MMGIRRIVVMARHCPGILPTHGACLDAPDSGDSTASRTQLPDNPDEAAPPEIDACQLQLITAIMTIITGTRPVLWLAGCSAQTTRT